MYNVFCVANNREGGREGDMEGRERGMEGEGVRER